MSSCCSGSGKSRVCAEGAAYVEKELNAPPKKAILCCEGGCIKGEVARVAANLIAYRLERANAVRICLGDASTANSGFIDLVNRAPQVIAIEGCYLKCGTEIMKTRIPDFKPTIVFANDFYTYDKERYFEIFDIPRVEIENFASIVAEHVSNTFFNSQETNSSD